MAILIAIIMMVKTINSYNFYCEQKTWKNISFAKLFRFQIGTSSDRASLAVQIED